MCNRQPRGDSGQVCAHGHRGRPSREGGGQPPPRLQDDLQVQENPGGHHHAND